jgi:hypothetical protein
LIFPGIGLGLGFSFCCLLAKPSPGGISPIFGFATSIVRNQIGCLQEQAETLDQLYSSDLTHKLRHLTGAQALSTLRHVAAELFSVNCYILLTVSADLMQALILVNCEHLLRLLGSCSRQRTLHATSEGHPANKNKISLLFTDSIFLEPPLQHLPRASTRRHLHQ